MSRFELMMPLNMHKLFIYLLSLVLHNTTAQNFCGSNYKLSYVFMIGDQITFGTKGFRWKYDVKYKSVMNLPSDDADSAEETVSYVAFDFDPCKHHTQQFCDHLKNAKNLLLYMSSNKYSAYRITCVNKSGKDLMSIPINDDLEMPWKLSTRGTVNADKFFAHSNPDITYTGLTFVYYNEKYALFASTVRQSFRVGNILVKRINKLGVIDTEWSIAYNGVFLGLFDTNGGVFALDNKNIFHFLELDSVSNKLIEKSKYNPKELYNCYQNSSLISETFNMCDATADYTDDYDDNTTLYSGTSQTITDNYNSDYISNEPAIISTLSTTSSERHSLVWWSVLMIMLVVALIITAIIYFIFGKKSKKQMSAKSMSKRINDEKSLETEESTLRTENDSI